MPYVQWAGRLVVVRVGAVGQGAWPLFSRAPFSLRKLGRFKQPSSHFAWQVPPALQLESKQKQELRDGTVIAQS